MKTKSESKVFIFVTVFLLLITLATIIITNYNKWYDYKTFKEIKNRTIVIKDGKIKKENEGKLVLVSGKLDYNHEELYDDLFYVHMKTPKLLRVIEMYQWYEYKEIGRNGKTIYKYGKKWSNEIIDSTKFKIKGYDNPKYKISGTAYKYPKNIKIGEYYLTDNQKEKITCNNRMKLKKSIPLYGSYKIQNNFITNSKDINNPKIGDNRVSYYYSDWDEVTILAKQSNNSFKNYRIKGKYTINSIEKDIITLKEIIDKKN